jgi:hypothetical protein
MSRQKGSGGVVLFAILIGVALLTFFGVITWKTEDLNDLFNLLRSIWQ